MIPTLQEIKDRVYADFQSYGYSAVGQEGAPETMLADHLANEELRTYTELDRKLKAKDPSRAVGLDLDALGISKGILRETASVPVDLTRQNVFFELKAGASTPQTIPQNTRLFTQSGVTYLTVESVTITDTGSTGRQYVNVRGGGEGASYNVKAGELTLHNYPDTNLISNNTLPIETGRTRETDVEYRPRVLRHWSILRGSNFEAVEAQLRSLPNVARLDIIPFQYGVGTVGVFVESTNPITGPALIAQVQAEAEASVATGTRIFVNYPEHLFLIGEVEVILTLNYTLDLVTPQVKQAVINYVNSLQRGETLVYRQLLSAIIGIDGIVDANFSTFQRGSYDVQNKRVQYIQNVNPSNLAATAEQKWVTSSEKITVCTPGTSV